MLGEPIRGMDTLIQAGVPNSGRLEARDKTSRMGMRSEETDSKRRFAPGGGEYAFNKNTALRVEWQKLASDTTTWSVGVKFAF